MDSENVCDPCAGDIMTDASTTEDILLHMDTTIGYSIEDSIFDLDIDFINDLIENKKQEPNDYVTWVVIEDTSDSEEE